MKVVESLALSNLKKYLGELGWPSKEVAANLLRIDYEGRFGLVQVMAHIQMGKLTLAVDPVLPKPKGGWQRSVHGVVGALNAGANVIEVGLDRSGDVFVKASLPSEPLPFEQFVYVLLNLCRIAEQLTVPILQAQAYHTFDA